MSDLLTVIPGRMVSLGASILDVHNQLKSDLTGVGWRVVSENTASTPMKLIVAPPASEPIGNTQCREVLSIETGASSITFRPIVEALQAYPQTCYFSPKTGGTASNAVTIGAVTVAQDPATLNAANTANDNLRYLYEALASSTDPVITDWDWLYAYPPPQNADDPLPHIYGIRKTVAPNQTITPNANVTGKTLSNYCAAGLQAAQDLDPIAPCAVTTDLVNGFIYFFEINKRGIAFSARTNAGYFGPIHACWGDHAMATNAMPEAGKWARFLSPVELVVGVDAAASKLSSTARVAKGLLFGHTLKASPEGTHPFGRFTIPGVFLDGSNFWSSGDMTIPLAASSFFSENDAAGDDFQIHRMNPAGNALPLLRSPDGNAVGTAVVPCLKIEDWYKFRGTATDENLQLVADTAKPIGNLDQTLDASTNSATLALTSTAGLPPAGTIQIENEAFDYTGISGSTLTGCTRGRYATQKARHFQGCPVYLCNWFIKINGGAIFCGPVKPV